MTEEIVYTVFHEDGPIRLTETELCNDYMELRTKLQAVEADLRRKDAERDRERKAWGGIERKASNLRHRLDALEDAARRTSHADHAYDIDVRRTDCILCAAIEGRYQPAWMEEPHEWMYDPIVRAAPVSPSEPVPQQAEEER